MRFLSIRSARSLGSTRTIDGNATNRPSCSVITRPASWAASRSSAPYDTARLRSDSSGVIGQALFVFATSWRIVITAESNRSRVRSRDARSPSFAAFAAAFVSAWSVCAALAAPVAARSTSSNPRSNDNSLILSLCASRDIFEHNNLPSRCVAVVGHVARRTDLPRGERLAVPPEATVDRPPALGASHGHLSGDVCHLFRHNQHQMLQRATHPDVEQPVQPHIVPPQLRQDHNRPLEALEAADRVAQDRAGGVRRDERGGGAARLGVRLSLGGP